MYKSILYVEDGSVDLDQLEQDLGDDVYVVVYRQGSTPPTLVQPEKPLQSVLDSENAKLLNLIAFVNKELNEAYKMKMSKKLRRLIDDIITELN
jgi:hypothetical protein